jgi:amino acid transporter
MVRKHDELERSFEFSKKKPVKLIVAFIGLIVSIFALVISFVPPAQLTSPDASNAYITILSLSFVVVVFIPFIVYHFMRKKNPLPAGKAMPDDPDREEDDAAPAEKEGN